MALHLHGIHHGQLVASVVKPCIPCKSQDTQIRMMVHVKHTYLATLIVCTLGVETPSRPCVLLVFSYNTTHLLSCRPIPLKRFRFRFRSRSRFRFRKFPLNPPTPFTDTSTRISSMEVALCLQTHFLIGASLSEPHTSGTTLRIFCLFI